MTRRDRIAHRVRIVEAVKKGPAAIRSTDPLQVPVELAGRLDAYLQAADDLVDLLGDEILALEAARDWGEP